MQSKPKSHLAGIFPPNTMETFRRHARLFGPSADADTIWDIEEGWAAEARTLTDGRRQIVKLYVPGDLCDLGWLYQAPKGDVVALTTVRARRLSAAKMHELSREPDFGALVAAELVARMNNQGDWLVALGCQSAAERVAQLLWELYIRLEANGRARDYRYDFPLGLQEVAEIVGITPVHASRTIKALRSGGLVELENRQVRLRNVDGLLGLCSLRAERRHPLGGEPARRELPRKAAVSLALDRTAGRPQ